MSNHVQEQLSAYLDHMLSPEETQRVESHLAACQECSQVLNELKQMVSWMKKVPNPVPRAGLETRLAAHLENPPARKRMSVPWAPVFGGVTVTAMTALLVVVLFHNESNRRMISQRQYELASVDPIREDNSKKELKSSTPRNQKDEDAYSSSGVGYGGGSGIGVTSGPGVAGNQNKGRNTVARDLSADLKEEKLSFALNQEKARRVNYMVNKEDIENFQAAPAKIAPAQSQGRLANVSSVAPEEEVNKSKNLSIANDALSNAQVISTESEWKSHKKVNEDLNKKLQFRSTRATAVDKEVARESFNRWGDLSSLELSGTRSSITKREYVTVRSREELTTLIQRMGYQASNAVLSSVDFSKDMVIAAFMGEQLTGGYSIQILSADIQSTDRSRVMIVKVKTFYPPAHAHVDVHPTQPFHMEIFPKFKGPVQFQEVN